MKKEFTYNIIFLLLINILIKPFYIFFIETKVQSVVGDEAFGLYFSLFGLVFLHQFINDPGIQNYNSVYVAQNRQLIKVHFPRLMGLKFVLYIITAVAVLISATCLGFKFDYFLILISIITMLFLSSLFVLIRSILSSLGYYNTDTWLSGLDRLLLVIIIGFFLLTDTKFNIHFFVLTQVGVYAFCVLIVLTIIYKKGIPIIPKLDFPYFKKYLAACLPYMLIIFLTAIIMRADAVLIQRLLLDGNTQTGMYAKGYRFLDAANMFGYLFGALLLPMFANKINDASEINSLFKLSLKMLWLMCLCIGFSFYFYKNEIFTLFYKGISLNDVYNVSPLAYTIIPVAMTNIFGPLIIAAKKIKAYNILFAGVVIFYIIANILIIPKYGILGASIICFTSWSLILFGMILLCIKYKLINFSTSLIYEISILFIILFSSFYGVNHLGFLDLPWAIKILISSTIALGLIMLIKIIDYKEILEKK